MANNKASRLINKLAASNHPSAAKVLARAKEILAADEQKKQREAAKRRQLEDKASFLLGAKLIKLAASNHPIALAAASLLAESGWQEYDARKLEHAIDMGVLSSAFMPPSSNGRGADSHKGDADPQRSLYTLLS